MYTHTYLYLYLYLYTFNDTYINLYKTEVHLTHCRVAWLRLPHTVCGTHGGIPYSHVLHLQQPPMASCRSTHAIHSSLAAAASNSSLLPACERKYWRTRTGTSSNKPSRPCHVSSCGSKPSHRTRSWILPSSSSRQPTNW